MSADGICKSQRCRGLGLSSQPSSAPVASPHVGDGGVDQSQAFGSLPVPRSASPNPRPQPGAVFNIPPNPSSVTSAAGPCRISLVEEDARSEDQGAYVRPRRRAVVPQAKRQKLDLDDRSSGVVEEMDVKQAVSSSDESDMVASSIVDSMVESVTSASEDDAQSAVGKAEARPGAPPAGPSETSSRDVVFKVPVGVRLCGQCRKPGHYRKTCPELKGKNKASPKSPRPQSSGSDESPSVSSSDESMSSACHDTQSVVSGTSSTGSSGSRKKRGKKMWAPRAKCSVCHVWLNKQGVCSVCVHPQQFPQSTPTSNAPASGSCPLPRDTSSSDESMLSATSSASTSPSRHWCQHCKVDGHSTKHCLRQHERDAIQDLRAQGVRVCRYCHKPGHDQRNCERKRAAALSQESGSPRQSPRTTRSQSVTTEDVASPFGVRIKGRGDTLPVFEPRVLRTPPRQSARASLSPKSGSSVSSSADVRNVSSTPQEQAAKPQKLPSPRPSPPERPTPTSVTPPRVVPAPPSSTEPTVDPAMVVINGVSYPPLAATTSTLFVTTAPGGRLDPGFVPATQSEQRPVYAGNVEVRSFPGMIMLNEGTDAIEMLGETAADGGDRVRDVYLLMPGNEITDGETADSPEDFREGAGYMIMQVRESFRNARVHFFGLYRRVDIDNALRRICDGELRDLCAVQKVEYIPLAWITPRHHLASDRVCLNGRGASKVAWLVSGVETTQVVSSADETSSQSESESEVQENVDDLIHDMSSMDISQDSRGDDRSEGRQDDVAGALVDFVEPDRIYDAYPFDSLRLQEAQFPVPLVPDPQIRLTEQEWLRAAACLNGLDEVPIRGDGDCFYAAIVQGLIDVDPRQASLYQVSTLRRIVAGQLRALSFAYEEDFEGPSEGQKLTAAECAEKGAITRAHDFPHFILYTAERKEFAQTPCVRAMGHLFPIINLCVYDGNTRLVLSFNPNAPIRISVRYSPGACHYSYLRPRGGYGEVHEEAVLELEMRWRWFAEERELIQPDHLGRGPCPDTHCHVHHYIPGMSRVHGPNVAAKGDQKREDVGGNRVPPRGAGSSASVGGAGVPSRGVGSSASSVGGAAVPPMKGGPSAEERESSVPHQIPSESRERSHSEMLYEEAVRLRREELQDDVTNQVLYGAGQTVELPWDGDRFNKLAKAYVPLPRTDVPGFDNRVRGALRCDQCMRQATRRHPLDVRAREIPRVKTRNAGAIKRSERKRTEWNLCPPCVLFLNGDDDWTVAQYSYLHDLLATGDYQVARDVWEELPRNYRDWWTALAGRFGRTRSSPVKDFTEKYTRAKHARAANSESSLLNYFEEHWMMNVRCPCGAFFWVDDAEFVQLHHYLYHRFGVKLPGADRAAFTGAVPNYPRPYPHQLIADLTVYAGTMRHEKLGLVVLFCKLHPRGVREQIVHEMPHPVIQELPVFGPDHLAPVRVAPMLISFPRSRGFNNKTFTSAMVIGYGGASTCKITSDPSVHELDRKIHDDLLVAWVLALDCRSSIREAFIANGKWWDETTGILGVETLEKWYRETHGRDDYERFLEECERSMAAATFIDVDDDYHVQKTIRARNLANRKANEEAEMADGEQARWRPRTDPCKFLLKLVHPFNGWGHPPFDMAVALRETTLDATAAIAIATHCRRIQMSCVDQLVRDDDEALKRLLRGVQKCARQLIDRGGSRRVYHQVGEMMTELAMRNGYTNSSLAERVSRFFQSVLPDDVSIVPYDLEAGFNLPMDNEIVLVYRPGADDRLVRGDHVFPPMVIGRHALVFALNGAQKPKEKARLTRTNAKFDFDFRWKHKRRFWQCQRDMEKRVKKYEELSNEWSLLIYVADVGRERRQEEAARGIGVQRKVVCDDHSVAGVRLEPLLKDTRSSNKTCCSPGCSKRPTMSCSFGCGTGHRVECRVGLCDQHFKDAESAESNLVLVSVHGVVEARHPDDDDESDFELSPPLSRRSSEGSVLSAGSSADSSGDEEEEVVVDEGVGDGFDEDEFLPPGGNDWDANETEIGRMLDVMAESTALALDGEEEDIPHQSRRDRAIVHDVGRSSIFSHTMLNECWRVMPRRGKYTSSTIQNSRMMQHIASVGAVDEALYYPHAGLFPTAFWYADEDGTVLGAMSSGMLANFGMHPNVKVPGIASLADHVLLKQLDMSLQSSRNLAQQHFDFDLKNNQRMARVNPTVLIRRGLETFETVGNVESSITSNDVVSQKKARELATLNGKEGNWSYFFTFTPNLQSTPGLAQLTKRLAEAARTNPQGLTLAELQTAFAPMYNRLFDRVVRLYMHMLEHSPESPIPGIKHMFWRYEYQAQKGASAGSMAHVHCGIALTEEEKARTLARICCLQNDFFSPVYGTDFDILKEQGFVKDDEEFLNEFQRFMPRVLAHDCRKDKRRCHPNKAGKCTYPKHPAADLNSYETRPMLYDAECLKIFMELGYIVDIDHPMILQLISGELKACSERIQGRKYHYVASKGKTMSPCIPRIWCWWRSSANVIACDVKFSLAYLLKYVTGKETHNIVDVKSDGKRAKLEEEQQQALKRTRVRMLQEEIRKKVKKSDNALSLCFHEMVQNLLDISYFYCSAEFQHPSTHAPEFRSGALKKSSTRSRRNPDGTIGEIPTVAARRAAGIPEWRRFTAAQILTLEDAEASKLHPDVVTRFSIRPPELLLFDQLETFFEWFVPRLTGKVVRITEDLSEQVWADGFNRVYRLRVPAVKRAHAYLCQQLNEGGRYFEQASALEAEVFSRLVQLTDRVRVLPDGTVDISHFQAAEKIMYERFVDVTAVRSSFVVVSDINPAVRERWFYHLCLTLGKFETEFEVFNVGRMKEAFRRCGLLGDEEATEADVLRILGQYLDKQALNFPIPQRKMCFYARTAKEALTDLLLDDERYSYGPPPVTEAQLVRKVSDRVVEYETERRRNILRIVHDEMSGLCEVPALEAFENATMENPLNWVPQLRRVAGQSEESFAEQTEALRFCIGQIDFYLHPLTRFVHFPVIHGPPGSGKTHLFKLLILYCAAVGLQFTLMSITSDRARTLGGEHVHLQIPLDTSSGCKRFPPQMVKNAVRRLLETSPEKGALLRRANVIFIEEIGFMSMQMYGIIDGVLRKVCDNNLPAGGRFIIANGDYRQLCPIDGDPFWASSLLVSNFKVVSLKHFVRCASDATLQRILCDFDNLELTTDERERIADDIVRNAQHVPSFDDVPDDAVCLVSKKEAERDIIRQFLDRKRAEAGCAIITIPAVDEVESGPAGWNVTTDQRIIRKITLGVPEERSLSLYVGATVRLTCNQRGGGGQHPFSQGQVAKVLSIDEAAKSIRIKLAPPGERVITEVEAAWVEMTLTQRYSQPVLVGAGLQKGRRKQIPVRLNSALTIHKAQGQTLPRVATKLSMSDADFAIWERPMLLVLISRTRSLRDLIFVGDVEETRRALYDALGLPSPWARHIQERLTALDVANAGAFRVITNELHPFAPLRTLLPDTVTGYVYQLVSMKNTKAWYIGETEEILRRSGQHNGVRGGSEFTAYHNQYRPWGVYSYICSFPDGFSRQEDENHRKFVEAAWKAPIRENCLIDAEQVFRYGIGLVQRVNADRGWSLTIVQCARLRTVRTANE